MLTKFDDNEFPKLEVHHIQNLQNVTTWAKLMKVIVKTVWLNENNVCSDLYTYQYM